MFQRRFRPLQAISRQNSTRFTTHISRPFERLSRSTHEIPIFRSAAIAAGHHRPGCRYRPQRRQRLLVRADQRLHPALCARPKDHNNNQDLIGLERNEASGLVYGGATFRNSFSQRSYYAYAGKRYDMTDYPVYLKVTGGRDPGLSRQVPRQNPTQPFRRGAGDHPVSGHPLRAGGRRSWCCWGSMRRW